MLVSLSYLARYLFLTTTALLPKVCSILRVAARGLRETLVI